MRAHLRVALAILGLGQGVDAAMRVAVTGAGGQTGGHVFRKMLARPDVFDPIGIARTQSSKAALVASSGCKPEQVAVIDVASVPGLYLEMAAAAFAGCTALVICTSAKVKPTGPKDAATGRAPMGFPDGQPYHVDWLGQRRQIDGARGSGMSHVVLCSSMGGTDKDHMLNKFGASRKGGGGILHWKRKAEKYLMETGLTYTIVHPGGLLNEQGGRRKLVVGLDDKLLPEQNRSIPREDVAEVLVQALLSPDYKNRSFDLVSEPDSGSAVETDFKNLLAPLEKASCDYSLGYIPDEAADIAEADSLMSVL